MAKSAEAFRSIGEVASMIGVAPHVLRYWETQFTMLKPMKRPDGRRYYRPADVSLAAGIFVLLRDDGLTIRGARKAILADRGEAARLRGDDLLIHQPVPMDPVTDALPRSITTGRVVHKALGPLPLFPNPDPAPRPVAWLARLTDLARHLQQITPADQRWSRVQPHVLRLARTMLDPS